MNLRPAGWSTVSGTLAGALAGFIVGLLQQYGEETPNRQEHNGHLFTLHQSVMERAVSQEHILWTLNAVYVAANAVLLTALNNRVPISRYLVAFVGAAISTLWSYLQWRVVRHLRRYEDVIEQIERRLVEIGLPTAFMTSGRVNAPGYRRHFRRPERARRLMIGASIVVALAWASYFVWSILPYLTGLAVSFLRQLQSR